ncbi:MAG: ribonuclease P protein component [Dehalococcoidia bacterium]|jgi:ribonuclease P protein component|nr:ribonuclease P protein component [Dehalococcoidia bacterium]
MTKRWALTKRAQYLAVYRSGKAWVNNLIVMKALPNECEFSRYGFSVTKNIGKAVVRNRIRRLLREISRITPVKPGWDIVFIARPAAVTADYHELRKSVETLLLRAHLINKDEAVRAGVN